MAVCQQGIYVEYSVEYSQCRALNGILVSTVDDCRLLNWSRRPFRPSAPGLGPLHHFQWVDESRARHGHMSSVKNSPC
eukprot:343946-Prorocentrum_minimum.AAC.1